MKTVLFLCSANFYRSRFAEHLFNWHARSEGLTWRADSRGIVVGRWKNPGPISRYALERLNELGIPLDGDTRFPRQLTEADLSSADLIVAVKEAEHRKMLSELFPAWSDRVEYWDIDDIDFAKPQEALPLLESKLHALRKRLACSSRIGIWPKSFGKLSAVKIRLTLRQFVVVLTLGGRMLPKCDWSSAAGWESGFKKIDALLVSHDRQGICFSRNKKKPSQAGQGPVKAKMVEGIAPSALVV
jgi:protein-tyrosine phosphatase